MKRAQTCVDANLSAQRLSLEVPYPPSANRLWRNVGGRTVKSREARLYAERVASLVWLELKLRDGEPPVPPFRVTVALHPPDRRRRDVDNPCKAALDAIWTALGMDDSTIIELHVYRREPDLENPRADVVIEGAR